MTRLASQGHQLCSLDESGVTTVHGAVRTFEIEVFEWLFVPCNKLIEQPFNIIVYFTHFVGTFPAKLSHYVLNARTFHT